MVVPRHVLGGTGYQAPSDTLNVAGVGVGGMGANNLRSVESENIVALCDIDFQKSEEVFNRYPTASRYRDYRVMFDEMGDEIDALIIATPDHTHAVIANQAMKMGMHVYIQKPLTHSVHEARVLQQTAAETGVVTQMGNQGHANNGNRLAVAYVRGGHLGEIKQSLKLLQQDEPLPKLHFLPLRGPFSRGIFATIHLESKLSRSEAMQLFRDFYAGHPFVQLSEENPQLKQVLNTNKCILYLEKHDNQLLIIALLDNLLKGASGQAVQNMNLMCGFPETTGLQLKGSAF